MMISLLTVFLYCLASIAAKLRLEGVSEFELSPGPPPLTVAAYVPGAKVSVKCAYTELLTVFARSFSTCGLFWLKPHTYFF